MWRGPGGSVCPAVARRAGPSFCRMWESVQHSTGISHWLPGLRCGCWLPHCSTVGCKPAFQVMAFLYEHSNPSAGNNASICSKPFAIRSRIFLGGLSCFEGISLRLGDIIDDHCARCKRTTDHAIAAMTGDDVVKLVCRTCNSEHKYHHNKTGKKEMMAEQAARNVLSG